MALFPTILGLIWIAFAAFLLIVSKSWIAFGINFVIGIVLIIFRNEEAKLEERKDLSKSKTRK